MKLSLKKLKWNSLRSEVSEKYFLYFKLIEEEGKKVLLSFKLLNENAIKTPKLGHNF